MDKRIRTWILAGIAVVILYSVGQAVYQIIRTSPCTYKPLLDSGKRCRSLFQDSINPKMECFHSFGNNDGADCAFKSEKYRFMIWELGDFRNIELKDIYIFNHEILDQLDTKKTYGEFEIGGNPQFQIRDIICFSMEKELDLLVSGGKFNIDKNSDKCLIASGVLDEIAFANHKKETQIFIRFEESPAYSLIVFLKKDNTFYIVLINSFENKAVPYEALQYLKL